MQHWVDTCDRVEKLFGRDSESCAAWLWPPVLQNLLMYLRPLLSVSLFVTLNPFLCRTGWTHVIVEKPFGRDSESSRELGQGLARHLKEEEIFRIDHYLGECVDSALFAMIV